MKVTRIAYSKQLNKSKYNCLLAQAKLLGKVRSEVWRCFGSLAGVGLSDRVIRDDWIKQRRDFYVSANAWKETLRDAKNDIDMTWEAAKVKVRKTIRRHATDNEEQKRLYGLLRGHKWKSNSYLRRMMRKYHSKGKNHIDNQIVVRSDNYTTFVRSNRAWLKVPSLVRGHRISIPLSTNVPPSGTLRLILHDNIVEVHFAVDEKQDHSCGSNVIGVDKGYTEVLVDSDGEHHGQQLGHILSRQSDKLKVKYQRRNKLRAIARNTKSHNKRARIEKNNLGRKKIDASLKVVRHNIRDVVFKAVHAVTDKAATIVAEDLTAPMSGKKFTRNINRRLASWTKGVIAEALESVSRRRGSSFVLVNCAYTSQMDSRTGLLEGVRRGDRFYCLDGEVLQADENAARNILARLYDQEIGRWTPFRKVKSILLERTERHRLGLLNQDSSCNVNRERIT